MNFRKITIAMKILYAMMVVVPASSFGMDQNPRKRAHEAAFGGELEIVSVTRKKPRFYRAEDPLSKIILDQKMAILGERRICFDEFKQMIVEHPALISSISPAASAALPGFLFSWIKDNCADPEIFDVLAEQGIRLELMRTEGGDTLLHQAAAYSRDPKVLAALCKHVLVDQKNEDGEAVFHYLAKRHCFEPTQFVGALLAGGADPNIPDDDGNTPLHLALNEMNPKIALELISAQSVDLSRANDDGERPIRIAAAKALKMPVEQLILKGVDMSGISSELIEPEAFDFFHDESPEELTQVIAMLNNPDRWRVDHFRRGASLPRALLMRRLLFH